MPIDIFFICIMKCQDDGLWIRGHEYVGSSLRSEDSSTNINLFVKWCVMYILFWIQHDFSIYTAC